MGKYNLQQVIKYCKSYSKCAGWKPTETDYTDDYATLTLVNENDDPLNATSQKLLNDLFLLLSGTPYTVDDAAIVDNLLYIKIAPRPGDCIKREICNVALKRQSIFNFTTHYLKGKKDHA